MVQKRMPLSAPLMPSQTHTTADIVEKQLKAQTIDDSVEHSDEEDDFKFKPG